MRHKHKRGRAKRRRREPDDRDQGERSGMMSGALQYVRKGARTAGQQIQRTLGDTTGAVLDTVLDEAERIYEQQRKNAISRVSSLSKVAARSAHALHAVKADGAAEYVEQAARQVERSTQYLRERELVEILEDAGDVIRRNPGAAMGGMFIVAFAVARFLKASASRAADEEAGGEEEGGDEQQRPRRELRKRPQRR